MTNKKHTFFFLGLCTLSILYFIGGKMSLIISALIYLCLISYFKTKKNVDHTKADDTKSDHIQNSLIALLCVCTYFVETLKFFSTGRNSFNIFLFLVGFALAVGFICLLSRIIFYFKLLPSLTIVPLILFLGFLIHYFSISHSSIQFAFVTVCICSRNLIISSHLQLELNKKMTLQQIIIDSMPFWSYRDIVPGQTHELIQTSRLDIKNSIVSNKELFKKIISIILFIIIPARLFLLFLDKISVHSKVIQSSLIAGVPQSPFTQPISDLSSLNYFQSLISLDFTLSSFQLWQSLFLSAVIYFCITVYYQFIKYSVVLLCGFQMPAPILNPLSAQSFSDFFGRIYNYYSYFLFETLILPLFRYLLKLKVNKNLSYSISVLAGIYLMGVLTHILFWPLHIMNGGVEFYIDIFNKGGYFFLIAAVIVIDRISGFCKLNRFVRISTYLFLYCCIQFLIRNYLKQTPDSIYGLFLKLLS